MQLFARGCAVFVLLYLTGCTHSSPAPEEVVRLWQSYIDHNQFDSARIYSTELARSYVDFLDALSQNDSTETEETQLYDLHCVVQGDSAICHYLIEGETGEKVPDTLILQKVKGHWLVHRVEGFTVIPVDSLQPGDDQIIFPSDSMDVELE